MSKYSYKKSKIAEGSLVIFAAVAGFLASWDSFKVLVFALIIWFIAVPPKSKTLLRWALLDILLVSFAIALQQLDRANDLLGIFFLLLLGAVVRIVDEKRSS